MSAHPKRDRVEAFLAGYPLTVQEIASAARRFLEATLPGIEETVDPSAKLIACGYGPGYKNLVCTLIMSRNGVKLGIFRGAELPDPDKLMTGTGKLHRHVPLRSAADLDKPEIESLLAAALAAWRARTASPPKR